MDQDMRTVVTGGAGFIGSHLCALLLDRGDEVLAVDALTGYYDPSVKRSRLDRLVGHPRFTFVEGDIGELPLGMLLDDADVVFHLAAQPGVRASWGDDFRVYVKHNILATQMLLEASKKVELPRLVNASSSSVYGDALTLPTTEAVTPHPVSPYGVTKLAAEHLCDVYRTVHGLSTASLRLFTVYGPGQRPDMAFSRLVNAAVSGSRFELFGSGDQTRDFTYVGDVVKAFVDAADSGWTGVANIGGGARLSMNEVIDIAMSLVGPMDVERVDTQPGDVRHTGADTTTARAAFGYHPSVSVDQGLSLMVDDEVRRARAVAPPLQAVPAPRAGDWRSASPT
jgi:nucleoside-diphosphate-sugar epimerase